MAGGKITINRTLVGIIALLCLGSSIALLITQPEEELWSGGFMRVGLLMGAFWLALPTGSRAAAWEGVSPATLVGGLLALFAIVRFPKAMIPLLIMVAVMGFFLRPRGKKRPRNRPE